MIWAERGHPPRYSCAHLTSRRTILSTGRTVVGVFAHPDDEALLAGGTLARYASEGARVAVITCTGGEAGESADPSVESARLAVVRREELRESCARLGVRHLEVLGYHDSGIPARGDPRSLAAAHVARVADVIATALAPLAPDAVITHDPSGGYGHPDHIRACEATARAVGLLERRPLLYHAVIPLRVVDAFGRAFAAAGIQAGRAAATGADMERDAGVPDGVVTTTIDVSAHVHTKRDALRAHRTQMAGHALFRLPWPVLADLWGEEHFALHGATGTAEIGRELLV